MSGTEIRDHLHQVIDKIDDVNLLHEIDDLISDVISPSENTMSAETKNRLDEAIEEGLKDIEEGKFISYEEFRKKQEIRN